ncbi:hypothetical protein ACFOZ7_07995 [Natribaculum luteum]|uniref:Uncharacterized protein n=1 Tax=Natribaculum luteum TaxID=1586232 RepID=A0ABD5NYY9_9EURY|nr:hypothetical protein [Natribaculum luteum]
MDVEYGETWVYESMVGAIPGVDVSERVALAIQFVAFEGIILGLAAIYDLWTAAIAGTVAVVVAVTGSWLMLRFSRTVRTLPMPTTYRRLLFGSGLEVVLGVLAYVAFVTYLFVYDPRTTGESLVVTLFGPEPPIAVVYVTLLVCWDLVYRIGASWWASVTGVWRAVSYSFDAETTRRYRRVDALNVVFAATQLLLVPFVTDQPVLLVALVGHVVAVTAATVLSVRTQGREIGT